MMHLKDCLLTYFKEQGTEFIYLAKRAIKMFEPNVLIK